ncbi:DUF1697 domain-containing protein [Alkalibacterium psychrotolerans]
MTNYVVLLRGINVGGKNKIKMADLKAVLTDAGFLHVQTYIQSGNLILHSKPDAERVQLKIEQLLLEKFELNSERLKVLALSTTVYQAVEEAPNHFGKSSDGKDYRYDVLFPINISVEKAMSDLPVREGIDTVWLGKHVIYYRRPGPSHPDYTKSGLNRLPKKAVYQFLTLRNWKTTVKMWDMLVK